MNLGDLTCRNSDYSPSIAIHDSPAIASMLSYAAPVVATYFWGSIPCASILKACCSSIKNQITNKVPKVRKILNTTGTVLKIACKVGGSIFVECVDLGDINGTKFPINSIGDNRQRLAKQDAYFADFCNFIADQAAQITQQMVVEQTVKEREIDEISEMGIGFPHSFSFDLMDVFRWLINYNQEWVAQTVKANVLHLFANLTEGTFNQQESFADDGQRNPLGRIVALVGSCIAKYEERLEESEKANAGQPDFALQRQIFEEMSRDLLALFFPKGAEDIKIFSQIPCMCVFKELLWNSIQTKLPTLLSIVYLETRPLEREHLHENWKANFDRRAGIPEAHKLQHAPSVLLQKFIRDDRGVSLDKLESMLEKMFQEKKMPSARHYSQLIVKYLRELLLSEDPMLSKIGGFIERCLMERLLVGLMKSVPETEEQPILTYTLKQWLDEPFHLIQDLLIGKTVDLQECREAVRIVFSSLGFDREESLPVSERFKKGLWLTVQKFQQDILPTLISQKAPQWSALRDVDKNAKRLLKNNIGDPSLVSALFSGAEHLVSQVFKKAPNFKVAEKLNAWLPGQPLSREQQDLLNAQWISLLNSGSLRHLEMLGWQGVYALPFQLLLDLFDTYQEEVQTDLPLLFEGRVEAEDAPSFTTWLIQKLNQACEVLLSLEGMSEDDLKVLRQAIALKNEVVETKDLQRKKECQRELEKLWSVLEPKFQAVSHHLLRLLGYNIATHLPIPKEFQLTTSKLLKTHLPRQLFEQVADLMLPLLEKQKHRAQLAALPQGQVLLDACQHIMRDVFGHLPTWLDKIITRLPEQLTAKIPGLTESSQAYVVETAKAFARREGVFSSVWQWVESYAEGMLFKAVLRCGQMSKAELAVLHNLICKTKEQLVALEYAPFNEGEDRQLAVKNILIQFTDDFFLWIGVETPQGVFGVPPAVRGLLIPEIKKKIAQSLLGFYHWDYQVRHYATSPNPIEGIIPTDKLQQVVRKKMQQAIQQVMNIEVMKEEFARTRVQKVLTVYRPLRKFLDKQKAEFQTAEWFKSIITQRTTTPLLEKAFQLMHTEMSLSCQEHMIEQITPFLADRIMQHVVALVQKEKAKGVEFDQTFLKVLIPLVFHHVKTLNAAAQQPEGLNFDQFVRAAGDQLHPAVPTEGDKKTQKHQRLRFFYDQQMEILFQLVLPRGQEDLKLLLTDFELTDKQIDSLWNGAKVSLAQDLMKTIDDLFKDETMHKLFKGVLTSALTALDQPIEFKVKKAHIEETKSPESIDMDRQVGELVVEVARLLDLPLTRLPDSMQTKLFQAIGAAMRKKFNGQFLVTTIQQTLSKLAEESRPVQKKVRSEESIDQLEKELIEKSFAYLFRYMGASLEHVTDIFPPSFFGAIRQVIILACSLIAKVIGTTLHLLRVDSYIVYKTQAVIKPRREKVMSVLTTPKVHENFIYRSLEAIEGILRA